MTELFADLGMICLYFIPMAGIALTLRFFVKIPDELFRKLLHFILLGSFPFFAFLFESWWAAALTAVVFAVVVYPVLMVFEKLRAYSAFTTERKKGELKASLLLVFGMFAVVIALCCGWQDDPWLATASIYAWGIGDAFAAIIGKKFGRHHLQGKYIDGKKSVEGTAAMFVTSALSVAILLLCRGGLSVAGYAVIPLVTAAVSAGVELYSKNGMDTVFCPLAAMAVLIPLLRLFGGAV